MLGKANGEKGIFECPDLAGLSFSLERTIEEGEARNQQVREGYAAYKMLLLLARGGSYRSVLQPVCQLAAGSWRLTSTSLKRALTVRTLALRARSANAY